MFTPSVRSRFWLLCALVLAMVVFLGAAFLSGSGAAPRLTDVTYEPAGHFGGAMVAIAVSPTDANTLYLGEGCGFTVVDVSDKAHPRQVAGLTLDGEDVNGIAVVGNTAYLANGDGLQVVSLANPTRPTRVGGLDLEGAIGIAVVGNTAYVACGQAGLAIVDVGDPLSPTLRGTYDTAGSARVVQVVSSTAYIADAASGLLILNVSDPAAPTLLGAYDTPGTAQDVQVVGSTAYVADDSSGLQILNVSALANPTRLGFYDTPGSAWDVEVVGSVAYVADRGSGVQILNVSNPVSPTLLATSYDGWWASRVVVAGNYAYVGDMGKGLRVLNVSNPASPTVVGAYERPSLLWDIAVSEPDLPGFRNLEGLTARYGYVVGSSEFWTLDLSDPAVPRPLSRLLLNTSAQHLVVSGTLAYVAEQYYGLEIVRTGDPLSPTVAGRCPSPTGSYVRDVFVYGSYAYLPTTSGSPAPGTDGWLRVVDVSNPANPTLAASFNTPGDARHVFVAPHAGTGKVIAYVADGTSGLRLVDVSNPRAPVALGSVPPPTGATTVVVFVSGNYAFVGSNLGSGWRLQKVDVSNPQSPAVVAETGVGTGQISDLTGYGDLLYVVGSWHVISQSDLAQLLSKPGVYVVKVEVMEQDGRIYVFFTLSSYGSSVGTMSVGSEGTRTPTTAPSQTVEPTRTTTPAPTATTIPPVQTWVDENGVLHIVLQGDADAKVTVQNGNVLVNGQTVGDPPAKAADIKGIDVQGGNLGNRIDLGEVKQADFPHVEKVVVDAGDGNDGVIGSEFDDIIYGGEGQDGLDGGKGNDILFGGPGKDDLFGGEGQDKFFAGPGDNVMDGEKGNDKFYPALWSTNILIDQEGDDTVDFSEARTGAALDLDLQNADQVVNAEGSVVRLEGQFENFGGSPFDDAVSVDPLSVPRLLQGGGGTDTLHFDAKGAWVADDGRVALAAGYAPVAYDGFEVISGTRPCPDLAPGESWDQVFTVAGSYPYHDPYNPSHTGTVVVGSQAQGVLGNLATGVPVSVTEEGFDPPVVTIPVEGMVRWTNDGTGTHAVAGTLYTCYLPLVMRR